MIPPKTYPMNLFDLKNRGFSIFLMVFSLLFLLSHEAEARIRLVPAEYTTIQGAVNASVHGDTVLVSDGFYPEQVNFLGKNIVVTSRFILDHDSAHIYNTEINRSYLNEGVKFINGEGPGAQLIGFTVSNCLWKAVVCKNSSPRIRNNLIRGNKATGIYLDYSAAIISDNEIHCYAAADMGSSYDAIEVYNSGPVIERNLINGNDPAGNVHAIYFNLWNMVLPGVETHVRENRILGSIFGGLSDNGLPQLIHHNIFTSPNGFSSALNITDCASNLRIFNNTVSGGSGIWIQGGDEPDIRNNVVAHAYNGIEIWADTATIAFNNIWDCQTPYSGVPDQTGINGNISVNPEFRDPDQDDFHFFCWSKCLDAGDPQMDYSLEPAPNGGRINMGCYGNTADADPSGACLRILPGNIDFGYVPVNTQRDSTRTLMNAGIVPLDISGVTNSDISSFGTNYPGGITHLNPGESIHLVVSFHPMTHKTHYLDSVAVVSNSVSSGRIYLAGHTALGINPNKEKPGVELYPMPVTGEYFYIKSPGPWPHMVYVEIMDVTGKRVYGESIYPTADQPLKIRARELGAGVFILRMQHGQFNHAAKFTVCQ